MYKWCVGWWKSGCNGRYFSAALDDLDQPPAFGLGQRLSLLNANPIAEFGLALLVVCIELFIAGDHFLVLPVRKAALDSHSNRFGHFIGDDLTHALLAMRSSARGLRVGFGNGFGHTRFLFCFIAQRRNSGF